MGLTVNNINTLSLLNILNRTSTQQSRTLTALSTGHRINKGSDDPAGLIALESLKAELTGVDAALTNNQRANSVLDTADAALGEVSSLLGEIESLAAQSTSSGGLSDAEIAANQSQIDNAIDAIDRIVRTTSFNGQKLLDGQLSIRTTASAPTEVTDVHVFSRPSSTSSQTFSVNVDTAGTVASATLGSFSAADSTDVSAAQFSVTGKLGSATITVADADTLATVAAKIVSSASETGVSATVNGNTLRIQSREYGDDAFVSSTFISGDADFSTVSYTTGADAAVTVNGQQAAVDGLKVSFNSNGTSGEFTLTSTGNVAGSAGNLVISGGGATFQLGSESNTRSTVGIQGLFSHQLGDSVTGYLASVKSGGTNDLQADANNAVAVVKKALNQVATQRGRIGGFQKFQIETSINSLSATKEALESAKGVIDDIDYAKESAELARQNVLLQSAISLLGVSTQQSSQVLSLLR